MLNSLDILYKKFVRCHAIPLVKWPTFWRKDATPLVQKDAPLVAGKFMMVTTKIGSGTT